MASGLRLALGRIVVLQVCVVHLQRDPAYVDERPQQPSLLVALEAGEEVFSHSRMGWSVRIAVPYWRRGAPGSGGSRSRFAP